MQFLVLKQYNYILRPVPSKIWRLTLMKEKLYVTVRRGNSNLWAFTSLLNVFVAGVGWKPTAK